MKAFVKKHKTWVIVALVAVAAVVAYCHVMPLKYVDDSKYTYKQRRAIVAEMKRIKGDVAYKALCEKAEADKKPIRQALEEEAVANLKAAGKI